VFDKPFMFYENPRGGTDQMDKAKAAGFLGGFGNVIDHPVEAWDAHRASARANGMWFGPWGRTGHPPTGFERAKLDKLVAVAKLWGSPLIVNSEKEIDNTGATVTTQIAQATAGLDAAVSMEAWPFGSVDWNPINIVLPQIMPVDWGWQSKTQAEIMARAASSKDAWHLRGVKCVYYTFGAFGGMVPGQFDLKAPYSLYPADAIGISNYQSWKPTSTGFKGCVDVPTPPPAQLSPKQIRAEIVKVTGPWTKANPNQRRARITVMDRIAEPFYTDAQWARMAPAIVAILDQEQDEG